AGRGGPFGWHLQALRDRRLLFASAVILLSSLVYSSIEGSFTLRFSSHLSQAGLGALIAVTAMTAGIGSTLPIATGGRRGVRTGRWGGGVAGGRVVAQAGAVLAGLLLIAVTGSDSPVAWFVLLGLVGLVLGAAESGSLAMVARMPEAGMLTAQVAYSQVWALGFLVGPPGTTWLATSAGKVAPGLALAAVGLGAAALGFWVREVHTSVRQAVDGEDAP